MSSRGRILDAAEEMQREWLWLPDEILYMIMGKLIVSPSNLSRFSFVCKRFHRLFYDALPKLVLEHQITPLLLAPLFDLKKEEEEDDSLTQVSWRIYNLIGECVLSPVKSLPLWPNRIIGSSFGWLIVSDSNNQSVTLFNPLLSKTCIRLPPFCFPPHHSTDLVKGVLSNPPQEDGHFDIAITLNIFYMRNCKGASRIAFLHVEKMGKLESLRWVHHHHNNSDGHGILDVNSIGGRICVLDTRGIIRCCKCSTDGFSYYYAVRADYFPCPSGFITNGVTPKALAIAHLLESSNSEPLIVFHNTNYIKSPSPDVFKIFTLTSSSGNDDDEINQVKKTWNWTDQKKMEMQHQSVLNWTEIRTVDDDDDVIFLEDRTSICINKDASPKLQLHPGSINFPKRSHPQGTDFRIYNVDQDSMTHFSHRNDDTKLLRGQPIWLHPC